MGEGALYKVPGRKTRLRGYRRLPGLLCILAVCIVTVVAGCDLFSPRTPEDPMGESGTFVQPDTPDQVIANVQTAISEKMPLNYQRSLAPDLIYHPSDPAKYPIWASWGRSEEDLYFKSLVAAAIPGGQFSLQLNNRTLSAVTEDRYLFEASYVLTVQHGSSTAPRLVVGDLIWVLVRGTDGLWSIQEWTDQLVGNEPSWSDLKALFL